LIPVTGFTGAQFDGNNRKMEDAVRKETAMMEHLMTGHGMYDL
jgi:hypothetical protein